MILFVEKVGGRFLYHHWSLHHITLVWASFNLLKPTGYVMHQQFNLLKPTGYVMRQQFNLLKPTG